MNKINKLDRYITYVYFMIKNHQNKKQNEPFGQLFSGLRPEDFASKV